MVGENVEEEKVHAEAEESQKEDDPAKVNFDAAKTIEQAKNLAKRERPKAKTEDGQSPIRDTIT